MTKNKFVYINYANNLVTTHLLYWPNKIQDYLIDFYGDNRVLQKDCFPRESRWFEGKERYNF